MSSIPHRNLPQRWRLVLGSDSAEALEVQLTGDDVRLDEALSGLYDEESERSGGLGASAPALARWLGDIRQFFPSSVVRVMQQDALQRFKLDRLLLEPELLAAAEPDVHLAATLIALGRSMPARTRDTARQVVRRIVDELLRRLSQPTRSAVTGALARSGRTQRPRAGEIDWMRTIRANLHNFRPELGTLVPERMLGRDRRRRSLRDVVLCIDQSGSMASSVVYASVFGAVLASLPSVTTRMIAFDTAVADLTENLVDPVELLFGVQLGGGTDIRRALAYAEGVITRPTQTTLVLISDLYEGGDAVQMLKTARRLTESGVQLIVLLALSDAGKPCFDPRHAAQFAALGAPVFACTPDMFPDLMATALSRRDVAAWAAARGVQLERPAP